MKALKFSKLLALCLVACLAFFTACEDNATDDECSGVECLNGGTCVVDALGVASCECAPGYSGFACEDFDPCFDVVCPDNAVCELNADGEATCFCNLGYQGDNCDVEIRAKYFGTYSGDDQCTSGEYLGNTHTIYTSSNGITRFNIEGFGGFDDPVAIVYAEIDGVNSFTIPEQTDGGGRVFVGTSIGTINPDDGTIGYSYQVTFSDGTVDACDVGLLPL